MSLARKCVAEGIGAFMIVFAGCGAIAVDQVSGGTIGHAGIAASFGLVVMAMIYATGHISGAHMNPAVTIAFATKRHFPWARVVPYIFAQCVGAKLAAGVLKLSLDPILLAKTDPETMLDLGVTRAIDGQASTVLLWEFLLTFALMFVVMGVATDYRAVSKAAGIAIGGTVWFEAMFAVPICRASMNPARSIGPSIAAWDLTNLWAYIIAPIAGALAGAWTYQFLRGSEPDSPGEDA